MITLAKPLSRPAILILGILLGMGLVLIPLLQQLNKTTYEQNTMYGQTLANSAARESVEAAFLNDKVSLRAILQAVAKNPNVLRASIYNVENQLLVQAGPSLHILPENARNFESAIAIHDSIAGSVTITLAPQVWPQSRFTTFYTLLFILGISFVIWRLYQERNFSIVKINKTVEHIPEPISEEIAPATEGTPQIDMSRHAYIGLCVKNVIVLKQQLNGEAFRKTFSKLERLLDNIGLLYGATNKEWLNDRYIICFSSNNQEDALFHAACAARLMLDLAGITNRVPLDLSAQIALDDNTIKNVDMPFVGLAVDQHTSECKALTQKVTYLELGEHDNSRKLITQFSSPYTELLQKQIMQFKTV